MDNKVIVLCGAPGTGKTTVRNYLVEKLGYSLILTHTTRPKRAGEEDGVDYFFEDQTTFFKRHYFEYVKYDDYFYGSSKEGLDKAFEKSSLAVIILDTKGALTYLKAMPKQTEIIYLTVKDEAVQRQRMKKRGDQPALIKKRLASKEAKRDQVMQDLPHVWRLENDDWGQTQEKLKDLTAKWRS